MPLSASVFIFCTARVKLAVRCALSRSRAASSGEHRVVIYQRVVNVAGRRGERTDFNRAVIQVMRTSFAHGKIVQVVT